MGGGDFNTQGKREPSEFRYDADGNPLTPRAAKRSESRNKISRDRSGEIRELGSSGASQDRQGEFKEKNTEISLPKWAVEILQNGPSKGSLAELDAEAREVHSEILEQKKLITMERNGRTQKIGIIEIPTFYVDFKAIQQGDPNYKSTTRDVRQLIEELKAEGIDGLVIDLRNNGGAQCCIGKRNPLGD